MGASGLRRIRQQPPARGPPLPPEFPSLATNLPPRAASMSLPVPSGSGSATTSTDPASPVLTFHEDLSRFPSESLHSFSFTQQSEEYIHSRQNILKRSIEFMRDRLGWAASNKGIASAQARISGDQEVQTMMELLAKANLVGPDGDSGYGLGLLDGPITGPAEID